MKILIILLISQLAFAYETDYTNISKSKLEFKKSQNLQVNKKVSRSKAKESANSNYIKIIHTNTNKQITYEFSRKYQLELLKCVAKNICVYKYVGKYSLEVVITKIKKDEKSIKAVYEYKKNSFVTF